MADAASRHFEKIFDAERQRGVLVMCVIRLLAVAAFAVLFGAKALDDPRWRGVIFPTVLLLIGAVVLLGLALRVPASAPVVAYGMAFLDVPLCAWINLNLAGLVDPTLANAAYFSLLIAQLAGCSLTLSGGAVLATAAATFISASFVYLRRGAGVWEEAAMAIALGVVAATSFSVQRRTRELVVASRKDDLMGKYILGERIGAGGMAEVFKATYAPEGGFERPVAIKRVLKNLAADPHFIERFRREAELTARLVHPNVVQVLDFGHFGDTWFLAMEFVDGVSLNKLVRPPLPLNAVVYVATQLCAALDFIHTRLGADGLPLRLVHRDFNPPNVLVSKLGEVKLADFGVARASDGAPLTQTGAVVGKLNYMPPEQLLGEPYDHRADLFALGVTLFELLTGTRAHAGKSEGEIMHAVLEASLPRPSTLRPEVPAALDAVVAELLARAPAQRPASALLVSQRLVALTGEAALAEGRTLLVEALRARAPAPAPESRSEAVTIAARAR